MCGIFGITIGPQADLSRDTFRHLVEKLFKLSESRGKEAAGLAVLADQRLQVFKQPVAASTMLRSKRFREFMANLEKSWTQGPPPHLALLGHSRLVTNGLQTINVNNQPCIKSPSVAVHNGIIVNDGELWERFPQLKRQYDVDTEVILALLNHFRGQGLSLEAATSRAFAQLDGSASLGILFTDAPYLLLATNTGSLYWASSADQNLKVFASESYILRQLAQAKGLENLIQAQSIAQVPAGSGRLLDLAQAESRPFSLDNGQPGAEAAPPAPAPAQNFVLADLSQRDNPQSVEMRRCTRCVLPETMPFIEFDEQGVCNFCREYQPYHPQGAEALAQAVEPYRGKGDGPDCIVTFSGGRDSSFMLHYVKRVLGLNPIAYTYDWGMVNDLARRNQARLCGRMGVEHVVVSADIKQKRRYIRNNILAWLRRPHLGMIPLFTAGDKQYFYFARDLQRKTGLKLVFHGLNPLEKTAFKTGFTGVPEPKDRLYNLVPTRKARLIWYYASQYLTNPYYFNGSFFDSLFAFWSSYLMRHDYLQFYQYIGWDQDQITDTLRQEYDWETASDTSSTWRIGDGTAAFYNYIYYTVAGFTEFDTFRSNQIREGIITRQEALELIKDENQPRWESMLWYAQQIGFDLDYALNQIHAIPKMYS